MSSESIIVWCLYSNKFFQFVQQLLNFLLAPIDFLQSSWQIAAGWEVEVVQRVHTTNDIPVNWDHVKDLIIHINQPSWFGHAPWSTWLHVGWSWSHWGWASGVSSSELPSNPWPAPSLPRWKPGLRGQAAAVSDPTAGSPGENLSSETAARHDCWSTDPRTSTRDLTNKNSCCFRHSGFEEQKYICKVAWTIKQKKKKCNYQVEKKLAIKWSKNRW